MRIDVHPSLSRKIVVKNDGPYFDTTESPGPIGNPNIALFVTEGVRKADAAVSIELCCITLMGYRAGAAPMMPVVRLRWQIGTISR